MQFSILPAIVALASTASARTLFHLNAVQASQMNITWSLSDWKAGCDNGTCSYNFNISGTPVDEGNSPIPAFSASCAGGVEGASFGLCQTGSQSIPGHRVAARLQAHNATDKRAHLAVSYRFNDLNIEGMWWNYTAYTIQPYNLMKTGFPTLGLRFSISPSEIFAAA